jgi:hypothetical protein
LEILHACASRRHEPPVVPRVYGLPDDHATRRCVPDRTRPTVLPIGSPRNVICRPTWSAARPRLVPEAWQWPAVGGDWPGRLVTSRDRATCSRCGRSAHGSCQMVTVRAFGARFMPDGHGAGVRRAVHARCSRCGRSARGACQMLTVRAFGARCMPDAHGAGVRRTVHARWSPAAHLATICRVRVRGGSHPAP